MSALNCINYYVLIKENGRKKQLINNNQQDPPLCQHWERESVIIPPTYAEGIMFFKYFFPLLMAPDIPPHKIFQGPWDLPLTEVRERLMVKQPSFSGWSCLNTSSTSQLLTLYPHMLPLADEKEFLKTDYTFFFIGAMFVVFAVPSWCHSRWYKKMYE